MAEVVLPKGVSQGTIAKYDSAIKHMDRAFHGVKLRDIRLSDMQQLVNALAMNNPNTGKPASKATLVNLKKVGNAIFRYARQNDIEGVPNFFDILQIPNSAPVEKRRALGGAEVDAVLGTPHWAQPMAMVMLFAGLRRGECVPLEWDDVDFDRRVLYVTRSVDLQENSPVVKAGGKTAAARRVVPMPNILADYLLWYKDALGDGTFAAKCGARALEEELAEADEASEEAAVRSYYFATHPTPSYKRPPRGGLRSDLVFPTIKGDMHSKSTLRRMWEDYLRELNEAAGSDGVPAEEFRFTAHNLRHTYATILFLQGVDVRDAMQYMGHATFQVTMDIYTDTEQYCRFDLDPALAERLKTDFKIPQPDL